MKKIHILILGAFGFAFFVNVQFTNDYFKSYNLNEITKQGDHSIIWFGTNNTPKESKILDEQSSVCSTSIMCAPPSPQRPCRCPGDNCGYFPFQICPDGSTPICP